MLSDLLDSSSVREDIQVLLDGSPVELPDERRSLSAIRSYLETLALERQRVLYSFSVDGAPVSSRANLAPIGFSRIEAETFDLDEMPVRIIDMAIQQATHAQKQVQSAISMVLVNDGRMAREFWWDLTRDLKQPLLTLTLLPDHSCGFSYRGASVSQLRENFDTALFMPRRVIRSRKPRYSSISDSDVGVSPTSLPSIQN